MTKPEITEENLEDALWFPEDYNWGPTEADARPTQGGGTAYWDQNQQAFIFVTPPDWWKECKPGDVVPEEWGVL